jgi:hypothetical protein
MDLCFDVGACEEMKIREADCVKISRIKKLKSLCQFRLL